ncbi:hypothetical protein PC115_g5385 [Phytophthora cactorum]|uniref:Uncharacterized protein n=1 Tax=Phytophthora cactorum TaxID=29920 RepID=A0A8T1D2H4_9STRA|nr:hypothetical protein PC115_g5385 [Phytophthora cactorum]KAG2948450.1 hypothetical protein PC117_g5990 [Phytophthora cactorum]
MDPAEYSRSNQNDLVSSLDLLEEEVLREASKHGPQWNRDKHLLVEGEPAVTVPRELSRISPRKPKLMSKASTRRRYSKSRGRDRSANNAEEEEASRRQLQLENERLHHEIAHWQREVAHARDEKLELEASFRRLDQEIGSGYHLAERKEKELRIAELVTKNQKMSQLLEKDLQSQEEQRRAHTELQGEHRKLTEHVTLLNQVLDTVETKHTELSSSHNTLLASYEAAQNTIETLQNEIHVLQDKLATSDTHVQLVTEYENKIQQWERFCRELEQKCEHKTHKLKQTQKIATATQQEAQRALDRQEELEQEVRNAHDQVIQTNAAMRTMEAKLETNLKTGGSQESLLRRIRQLEGELQQMNRANAELMQTCNQLLSSQRRPGSGKVSHTARNGQAMASQVAKLTTRITSLTDKLISTEEARDRKGRSLDILMHAFPFLLRRLDAMQDQLAAAVESNDIIQSALEQMQDPPKADHVNMSGSMYLHLARDKYLLEAPYPLELLANQTGAQVLSRHPESTTRAKTKKFSPFRVTCSALKPKDNQQDESEDQMDQLVTLSAVSNDTSGASYLNRSKINAFLEVIQCSAARKKFKTLVIGKLAECLHKLRELAHRSASEAATQQASIQMLQREVIELQYRLKNYHNDDKNDQARGSMAAKDSYKTRQFLLKMVDVYAEKQHENDHRQMTFVTQPLSSDMLITKTHNENYSSSDDRLLLPESQLKDDEVGQLLLKILVSGVSFREINLDSNNLSDVGAQHVADFLEKSLTSVRVLSLVGNKRITRRGIELIKGGLLRNQRVQRVSEDEREVEDRIILRGLAIGRDFDVSGNATEVLRVILSIVSKNEEIGAALTTATPEAVDAMTEKLRQLGFRYNIRPASASSRPRSAPYNTKKRIELHPRSTSAVNFSRRASAPTNFNRKSRVASSSEASTRRSAAPEIFCGWEPFVIPPFSRIRRRLPCTARTPRFAATVYWPLRASPSVAVAPLPLLSDLRELVMAPRTANKSSPSIFNEETQQHHQKRSTVSIQDRNTRRRSQDARMLIFGTKLSFSTLSTSFAHTDGSSTQEDKERERITTFVRSSKAERDNFIHDMVVSSKMHVGTDLESGIWNLFLEPFPDAAFKVNSPGSRQVVTTLIEGGSRKKKILRYLTVASGKPVLRMMWIISLLRCEGKHTRPRMSFSNSFVISVKDLETLSTLSGIRLLRSHPSAEDKFVAKVERVGVRYNKSYGGKMTTLATFATHHACNLVEKQYNCLGM